MGRVVKFCRCGCPKHEHNLGQVKRTEYATAPGGRVLHLAEVLRMEHCDCKLCDCDRYVDGGYFDGERYWGLDGGSSDGVD